MNIRSYIIIQTIVCLFFFFFTFPAYSSHTSIDDYKVGRVGTPLIGFTPPHLYACLKPEP